MAVFGLFLTEYGTSKGKWIQDCAAEIQWSGSYTDCTRTLVLKILRTSGVKAARGSSIQLYIDGTEVWEGWVHDRTGDDSANTFTVTAYDRGWNLNKSEYYGGMVNVNAATGTRQICSQLGVTAGNLAEPAVGLTRYFMGVPGYKAIMTLYTLSSDADGKKYHASCCLRQLDVSQYYMPASMPVLEAGHNLYKLSYTETGATCNSVRIVNKDTYTVVNTTENAESISKYGLLRSILSDAGDDVYKDAQEALEDGAEETTLKAECDGDPNLRTGRMVYLKDDDFAGVFYITGDTHTLTGGRYSCTLSLSYKCLMDEQEAGDDEQ